MGKVKLNVLGISYSQTQTGAYALVLAEEDGNRRIPIIVGGFEAQAIAIQLEGLKPARPLTHDLFFNFSSMFGITLLEVNINKLEEGVFYSKLTCFNGDKNVEIDSRTSDAIALALRFKCPIFTTEEILGKAGIIIDFEKESDDIPEDSADMDDYSEDETAVNQELSELSIDELKKVLDEAVKNEDYERASQVRDEINRRK
ncbi:MAG: bifunctional nuclease family protein [Bacteroidales bacterium]|nr:bifunctional nuclease family protein [Bacteroidales bacterium]MBN2818887.1 bifunctional nuclease family protein [Bacteroidales bacterium]